MSLKWMLGGEINHKFIAKEKRKLIEQEEERFSITLKRWKKSQNPIELKIKNLIEYYKEDPNYPKLFLFRHPELLNNDQKVYAIVMLSTLSEDDKDKNCFNFFIKSDSDIKFKIKNILEANKYSKDKDFARRFFTRHPELIPSELNPFIKKETNIEDILVKKQRYIDELIDWNKDLQEKNQELSNENKELKQKIKKYEQTQ